MSVQFSLIICCYNPDVKILKRLIESISKFDKNTTPDFEVIIVDNNSSLSIDKIDFINTFIKNNFNVRLIIEMKPGLTNARIAGIKNALNEWIIFFDDDNEPECSYLTEAEKLINNYKEVGAWGPGKITVEYIGIKASSWLEQYKDQFQEISKNDIQYDNVKKWEEFYPYGTGMCINKKILDKYVFYIEKGIYTLSDRKGKNLSSGGDVQIVLTAIKEGWKAGSSPTLQLRHLININKANLYYLQKQAFGTASAYLTAHLQVFPDSRFDNSLLSNSQIMLKVYGLVRNAYFKNGLKYFLIRLAKIMGEINAVYIAKEIKVPYILRKYQNLLNE